MEVLVSVLMCVYNTPADYLRESIESILNQSYRNTEFIIVDDGSDDSNTIDYLLRVSDENICIKTIQNDINLGLTRSLNIGLSHCNGKYIARMDSDDVAKKDRIRKQVEYMEAHEEVALLGTGVINFGDGVERTYDPVINNESDDFETYKVSSLLRHSGPPHPTFMFRTSFLRTYGIKYREDILKAQDYGIMADILKANGQIRTLKEPLLMYRVHQGQITQRSEIEQKAYQCRVSYDFIIEKFPCLSEPECACISLLGCEHSVNEVIDAVNKSGALGKTCHYIKKNLKYLEKPDIYVGAIKKILKYNKDSKEYNEKKLEAELRYRWWKKALRTSKEKRRPWGAFPYTMMSHRFV